MQIHLRFALLIALAFVGCTNNQPAEQVTASGGIVTTINFVPDTGIFDAIKLFESEGVVPDMTVRVLYPDHESEVEIGGLSADETTNEVLATEGDLLDLLISQFDPNDRREGRIFDELTADLGDLRTNGTLEARRVVMNSEVTIEDGIVDSVVYAEIPSVEDKQPTVSYESVIDYTGDTTYAPAGGTSTVYTSGSLQPTENLVVYYYNDAPGVETAWVKN
jgi:hypothetical protein